MTTATHLGAGFDFARARRRIDGIAWRTPVLEAGDLGTVGAYSATAANAQVPKSGDPLSSWARRPCRRPRRGAGRPPVLLKLESLQRTGSFKVRGAANRMLALTARECRRGVVAASSGNHGRAVARVARRLGIRATICVPRWTDPSKLRAIRASADAVELCGGGYDGAEARAAELAESRGLTVVHAFDDLAVIEGQGTIMTELAEQAPGLAEVVVPLSGGGLAAGVGLAARALGLRVTAVSARRASVMVRSIEAGAPVAAPDEDTIASALSGGIGLANRFTFRAVREVVDEHVIVEEDDIRAAVAWCFRRGLVVEGGGAVGIAAISSGHRPAGPAAVIVSGGNIDARALVAALQPPGTAGPDAAASCAAPKGGDNGSGHSESRGVEGG